MTCIGINTPVRCESLIKKPSTPVERNYVNNADMYGPIMAITFFHITFI